MLIKAVREGNWASQGEKYRCKWTATLILKYPPDKPWSMNVLGSYLSKFDLTHPIFKKEYVKPKEVKPELDDALVPNLNGFFTGLPEVQTKRK